MLGSGLSLRPWRTTQRIHGLVESLALTGIYYHQWNHQETLSMGKAEEHGR